MNLEVFVIPATIIALAYCVKVFGKLLTDYISAKQAGKAMKSVNKMMKLTEKLFDRYLKDEFGDE
jgi:hypothetical protein